MQIHFVIGKRRERTAKENSKASRTSNNASPIAKRTKINNKPSQVSTPTRSSARLRK